MAAPSSLETRTLGEIAFGGPQDAPAVRARLKSSVASAAERTVEGAVWAVARDAILHELIEAAQQLLGATALEALSAGYRVNTRLVEAARASVATPEEPIPVELARHKVTVSDAVDLDVRVGELPASIGLEVEVQFDLDPLVATVCDGKLASIGDGTAGVAVTLRIGGDEVWHGDAELRVNVRRTFDPAIVLLGHV